MNPSSIDLEVRFPATDDADIPATQSIPCNVHALQSRFMPARLSKSSLGIAGGFVALFLSSVLHGSDLAPRFHFINFARIFWPHRITEWYEHQGVSVRRGVLTKQQCAALVREVHMRSVERGGLHGLETETTGSLCRIPEAIDAARRVLNATSHRYQNADLRIDDLHVHRRRVPITQFDLQDGPLPWYVFLTLYLLDFFIGDRLKWLVGRNVFSRYHWSFNGNSPSAERCLHDAKTGKCTLDKSVCCAWRTHSAILFLTDEQEGSYSGGDFTYIDPYSWSSVWMQYWHGWVRVQPECGKLVMFENKLEPAIVHSITPLWSTSRLAFENHGRYTLNMWFTDLGDADAEGHFRSFAGDRVKPDYRDFGTWPQHRCLSGHSAWRKAFDSPRTQPEQVQDEQPAPNNEDSQPESKQMPDIFPWPVDYVFEAEPVVAPEVPVTKAAYQAGITALHHDGSKAPLRINVPGGRRLKAADVFKEAVQYVEKHPNRALSIMRRLARELDITKSCVQTIHSAEPFLRGIALQAKLPVVRERLKIDKVIGAERIDRATGIALLLLNTALSETNPIMEL